MHRPRSLLVIAAVVGASLPGCRPHSAPPGSPSHRGGIEVVVDQRIELLTAIFRLAGAEEFGGAMVPRYAAAVDSFFAPYRGHPAVAAVRRLRQERGISNDAVMSLAVHLSAFPELRERIPPESSQLEKRWHAEDVRAFTPLVQDFARTSHADRFFAAHAAMYDSAIGRMRALLSREIDEPWFASFFGAPPEGSRFIVVIAPNNGNYAYGTRFWGTDGSRELYAVMNVHRVDSTGIPLFPAADAATIVHEFSHSFVNPVVERHLAELSAAGDTLLAVSSDVLRRQGYSLPQTVVSESIVRAAVARYLLAHKGSAAASSELEAQKPIGFVWIDEVYALLGAYEKSRHRYPTLESFVPEVASFLDGLAVRARGMAIAYARDLDARRPHVLTTSPVFDANVDPATSELVFVFDRRMRPSYFVALVGPAAREHFPTYRAEVRWDSTRTRFTMPVTLKPDWDYEFSLNRPGGEGFISEAGAPLAPYRVKFRTRRP